MQLLTYAIIPTKCNVKYNNMNLKDKIQYRTIPCPNPPHTKPYLCVYTSITRNGLRVRENHP